jgi:hypothetical protein
MVPESEIKTETHKSGHRLLDMIVAGSAVFVSLCSLGLAIHSGQTMDRLVEASSRPVLVLVSGNVDPEQPRGTMSPMLYFAVENPGAGNARVEWARLEVQGREVQHWNDALQTVRDHGVADGSLPGAAPIPDGFVTTTLTHLYVKPGSSRLLFTWARTQENADVWKSVDGARHSFHLSACYCSIFEQCWVVRSDGDSPAAVKSCAVDRPKDTADPL